jgi:hypothetical protein
MDPADFNVCTLIAGAFYMGVMGLDAAPPPPYNFLDMK